MIHDKRNERATTYWSTVDEPPAVTDEIQLWTAEIGGGAGWEEGLRAVLTAEECARAARTRAGVARNEFMFGRAMLRALLGRALGMQPQAVALEVSQHGKPSVSAARDLWFNVSHSHGTLVLALTRCGPVGVDVERVDAARDLLEVAHDVFAAEDLQALQSLAPPLRSGAFYRCWTRKEAVLKADGRGLTVPLASFKVGCEDQSDVVIHLPAEGGGLERAYFVREFSLSGYLGAIAREQTFGPLQTLRMSPRAVTELLGVTDI